MKYEHDLVPITLATIAIKEEYDVSDVSSISKVDLTKLATKLRKGKKPALTILASFYSFQSSIKNFLYAQGAKASLSITQD